MTKAPDLYLACDEYSVMSVCRTRDTAIYWATHTEVSDADGVGYCTSGTKEILGVETSPGPWICNLKIPEVLEIEEVDGDA